MITTRLFSGLFALLISFSVAAQTADDFSKGNSFGVVYSNFHYELSNNEENGTAFEIRRAYLGYQRAISPDFKAEIKLDIGSPGDVSQYSLLRRFAYFRTAALFYSKKGFQWGFGLLDLEQFKHQERFWGYRYIYKSFQDEQRYGHSADLGTSLIYKPNKFIHFDFFATNGEGANRTQNDNHFKFSGGITVFPVSGLSIRTYADVVKDKTAVKTWSVFAGYTFAERFRLGVEGVLKENENEKSGFDRYGYSACGSYTFLKNFSVFARYDYSVSNIPSNWNSPWNINSDGSAIIAGLEFRAHEKVRLSVNYQDWVPYANDLNDFEYVFFNIEFRL